MEHKTKIMRKFKYIILSLGLFALMLSSCNKEKQNHIVQNSDEEIYWTAKDLKVQDLVLDFQDKIKNNTFKNGEIIEFDSAIWYLEALLNFNYSTTDSSFSNLTIDTTFDLEILVNNEMVGFENVADAAFAMEEHMVTYLNNLPNTIKFIIVADVSVKQNDLKSGSKTLSVTTSYGLDYINNPLCYPSFGVNDYWKWGRAWANDGGYCAGPNQGQETSSDAAEEIEYKINNPSCYQQNDGRTIISGVTIRNVDAWEYPNPDDDQVDNYLDCLMFYNDDQYYPVDVCLDPTEMDFYMFGTLDVIDSELQAVLNQNPGETWEFIHINLVGDHFNYNNVTTYFHWADITYGRRVPYIPPID